MAAVIWWLNWGWRAQDSLIHVKHIVLSISWEALILLHLTSHSLEAGLISLKDDSNKYEYKLQEAQELAQSLVPHSKQVN